MTQNQGLDELEQGYQIPHGLRHVLCVLTMLTYNLVVVYIFSQEEGDLEFCESALHQQLLVRFLLCTRFRRSSNHDRRGIRNLLFIYLFF